MSMCPGCYRSGKEGFCTECREKLFDGAKVSHKLAFDLSQPETSKPSKQKKSQLAIPGVNLKYSLQLKGSKLQPAEKSGQYIIKTVPALEIPEWDDAPENEHLTMQIAAQLYGMRTAENVIMKAKDGTLVYLTRRFDKKEDGKRFLMEDLAQISGHSKYHGTYEEAGLLIRKLVPLVTPALESFFQMIAFNYLFSNADAHLRDFSLIQNEHGQYVLAPAYGLVSTAPHMPNKPDSALPFYEGDKDNSFYNTYGFYGRPQLLTLAQKIGVLPGRAERVINELMAPADEVIVMISQSYLQDITKEKYIEAFQEKLKRLKMTG